MKWIQDRQTGKLIPEALWRTAFQGETHMVIGDIGDFETPTGVWLHGRKQLRDDLKRENCHVYERGEREYIDAMRAQAERAEGRALHNRIAEIAAEKGLGRPD